MPVEAVGGESAAVGPPEGAEYAGLGRRLSAWAIDFVIATGSVTVVVGLLMRGLMASGLWAPGGPDVAGGPGEDLTSLWSGIEWHKRLLVVSAFFLLQGALYYTLLESSSWQATPGKRLLDIYVAKLDGARLSWSRALARWVSEMGANYFWLSFLSLLTVVASSRRQAVHDMPVGTIVLRGKPADAGSLERWRLIVGLGLPAAWMLAVFLYTM